MNEAKALLIQAKETMLLSQLKALNYRGCSKSGIRMKQIIEILIELEELEKEVRT